MVPYRYMSKDFADSSISRRELLKKGGALSVGAFALWSVPPSLDRVKGYSITNTVKEMYKDTPRNPLSDDVAVSYEAGAMMTASGVGTNLALKHVFGVEPRIQAGTSAASSNAVAFTAGLDQFCESIWLDYVSRPPFANGVRGVFSLFSDVSYFSTSSLVEEIFSNQVLLPEVKQTDSELVLATLNAKTGDLKYHSSKRDSSYMFDSLQDIVLSNMAEPITHAHNVDVYTGQEVEPCFDPFYGETIIHNYPGMEDMIKIYVATRTDDQVRYQDGNGWKRSVREWMSLRNTEYDAKRELIKNIEQTSLEDRKRMKEQEHSVFLQPTTERSRTNTRATYISDSIRRGFLESVHSKELQDLLGVTPDTEKAYKAVRLNE